LENKKSQRNREQLVPVLLTEKNAVKISMSELTFSWPKQICFRSRFSELKSGSAIFFTFFHTSDDFLAMLFAIRIYCYKHQQHETPLDGDNVNQCFSTDVPSNIFGRYL